MIFEVDGITSAESREALRKAGAKLPIKTKIIAVTAFCLKSAPTEAPPHLLEMLKMREEARKRKNFTESDRLRQEILQSGYLIEDTPEGARLKKQ